MKKMFKMIQKAKKSSNEGFSLVELIIVISIMAILMGVVGTQVLPYLNKSKEANDNQLLSKFHTAAVSAFAFNADTVSSSAITYTFDSSEVVPATDPVIIEMKNLMGVPSTGSAYTYFKNNATSPNGQAVTRIVVEYAGGVDGKITVKAFKGAASTDQVLKTIESK